jgi:hypothetical protein
MADYKKISDFSEASAFEDSDKLLVSKSGITWTILGSKIKAYCQAAISTLVAQVNADATAAANAKTAAQSAQTAAESAKTTATQQATNATNANTAAQQAAAEAQAAAAAMQECAAYSASTAYAVGNMATYNGSTYRCTTACTGVAPTNTANWLLIAAKGTDGAGSGDMLASVYDPAGGAKQVAFSADLQAHTGASDIHVTAADKSTWNGKQNALTFDAAPTAGSTNPVTSNGIYAALAAAGGLFWATYGTTTSAQIEAAYQAGKLVCVFYSTAIYVLSTRGSTTYHVFTKLPETATSAGLMTARHLSCISGSWGAGDLNILTTTTINRSTAVNVADTNYTTLMARGESLNSADTTPTVNGAICWTYG